MIQPYFTTEMGNLTKRFTDMKIVKLFKYTHHCNFHLINVTLDRVTLAPKVDKSGDFSDRGQSDPLWA